MARCSTSAFYPLQLCTLALGQVAQASAFATIGETGVDEQTVAILRHEAGGLGVVKAAIRVGLACTARIAGTEGAIDIPAFMHCPGSLTVSARGTAKHIDASYEGNGLRFEIAEVNRCLVEGRTESPVVPLDESVALASVLDEIRAQIGLVYPGE